MPTLPTRPDALPSTSATNHPLRFDDLALIEPLRRAVREEGYETPTPIQRQAIPHVLAARDVLGVAQTGTGKTAAFALPILQRLLEGGNSKSSADPRVLVLSPTRELASQIAESFTTYGRHTGLTSLVIFGGVGQDAQVRALRRGPDVLVATPGRLLDLMQQRLVRLDRVGILVLDEADRMLDMGFLPDVRRIVQSTPRSRQTLFFSATMPDAIVELSRAMLVNPIRVEVTPVATTADRITQSVYMVERADKRRLLETILRDASLDRALVFTRTKHGANRVVEQLERAGVRAEAIHGNKSQNARERALAGFRAGTVRVLVATDIAARGIDIDGISHVVNYDIPNISETYVHRIGRTARAGAEGVAISFCDREERAFLADIEKLIRQRIPRVDLPGFVASPEPEPPRASPVQVVAPREQRPAGPPRGAPRWPANGRRRSFGR